MFIGRNIDGTIYGTWTVAQPTDEQHPRMEEVPDNHPDVVAFLIRSRLPASSTLEGQLATLESRLSVLERKP